MIETADRNGALESTFSIKVSGYMTPATEQGIAIVGQPKPQLYFDRPLHQLLGSGFGAGFVVDALEERAFQPDERKAITRSGGATVLVNSHRHCLCG
ncbi:MAG: hypothetical protein R2867_23030 [Caldilineaceae bacterium]